MNPRREEGFTLVELLAVVSFVVVLGVLVLVGFWGCWACQKTDDQIDKVTYSECVGACSQLEGEEAEAECLKRCGEG